MMHGGAEFLITAAVGYLVLERAEQRKGSLQRIGRWVGGAIIVASLLGAACAVSYGLSRCPWGPGKAGGYCPMMGKPTAP